MNARIAPSVLETTLVGAIGGTAGGVAEVIWVATYGAVTGASVGPVARGVVATLLPAWAAAPWSFQLGLSIHIGLAIGLGIGLAFGLRLLTSWPAAYVSEFGVTVTVLAAVWAINFLLVLPMVNPAFVHILPFAVTLASKLLFGLSAASVFRSYRLGRPTMRYQ